MKNTLIKIGIAFSLSLFFSWVYLFTPQAFYTIDNKLRDFMFLVRGELPKNDRIVIIDIDNTSLHKIGQWPWPRNQVAQLINTLTDAHAGIIGLDMVFSEPDRTSPHLLKNKFPELTEALPNYEEILAKTFATSPVVGGYTFSDNATGESRSPLIPAVFIQQGLKNTDYLKDPNGIVLNIPRLQDALYSSGFFHTTPDGDGIIRSTPLVQRYQGEIYPSLAFEMVRIYSGSNTVKIIGDDNGVISIAFGDFHVPTDQTGALLINFRGPKHHFKYISASDIMDKHFDPKEIEDKFVLIGTSALGLKDLRSTPFDSTSPGVEVHANIIDNIMQGDFISKPLIARLYDLAIIWVLVFSLMLLFSFVNSYLMIPFATLLLLSMLYLFYSLLFNYGLAFTLATPILAFFSTLIFSLTYDYFIASKHKEQAQRILGKKVSPSVMHYLLAHSDEDLVSPKEVEATVFFSDIRSFTGIAEKVGSPTKLIALLNSYMTPMVENIIEYKGTIDKFIGDAIMAYWNAPVEVKDHADMAVSSALKQIDLLQKINKHLSKQYEVTLQIGIGIHTGIVTAGDMGSEGRSDYTVIGDNVNIASRLESLTKVYHTQILISKDTYTQLKKAYTIRLVDVVELKGKQKAIEVFEVIPESKKLSEKELHTYHQGITFYRNAKVFEAYKIFKELIEQYSDPLYALYEERCKHFIDHPELTFSPVTTMERK